MSDLISRQAAIDALTKLRIEKMQEGKDVSLVWKCLDEVLQVPSAQPEIIHCRDCRWRKDQSGSTEWLPCRVIVTPSDFYCGRAERRTE